MKIKFVKKAAALVLCVMASLAIAYADPKDKEKKGPKDSSQSVTTQVNVGIFVGKDRDLIRQHYAAYHGSLPPGLAKREGDLPPGLEKQLRRKGHLPPGLEKKLHPFPVVLERRLPPLGPGLIRGMIGGSAVIVDKRTSVILDVFAVL